MNEDFRSLSEPDWLRGRGRKPSLKWQTKIPGTLGALIHSQEAGDFFAASHDGQLFRIDRHGEIAAVIRFDEEIAALDWSEDGSRGAVIVGERTVLRLDRQLQVTQTLNLPDVGLGISISPFGNHLAVGLANGTTHIFGERKRRIAQFETLRPMMFLQFCATEPVLFGAAEHGLICCHNLEGALIWQQSNWSNAGRMRATGPGDLIYLAGFGHGVQTFDGDGNTVGTYAVEGTTSRVDCTFEPKQLFAATIERSLHWMSSNGDIIWSTTADDDVADLVCDPLGAWGVCGFSGGRIVRLDW